LQIFAGISYKKRTFAVRKEDYFMEKVTIASFRLSATQRRQSGNDIK